MFFILECFCKQQRGNPISRGPYIGFPTKYMYRIRSQGSLNSSSGTDSFLSQVEVIDSTFATHRAVLLAYQA